MGMYMLSGFYYILIANKKFKVHTSYKYKQKCWKPHWETGKAMKYINGIYRYLINSYRVLTYICDSFIILCCSVTLVAHWENWNDKKLLWHLHMCLNVHLSFCRLCFGHIRGHICAIFWFLYFVLLCYIYEKFFCWRFVCS